MEQHIIERATILIGDSIRAQTWYRSEALAGFGGNTAEELVGGGQADAVLRHLEALELGGFA